MHNNTTVADDVLMAARRRMDKDYMRPYRIAKRIEWKMEILAVNPTEKNAARVRRLLDHMRRVRDIQARSVERAHRGEFKIQETHEQKARLAAMAALFGGIVIMIVGVWFAFAPMVNGGEPSTPYEVAQPYGEAWTPAKVERLLNTLDTMQEQIAVMCDTLNGAPC